MSEDTRVQSGSASDRAIGDEGRDGRLGAVAGRADGGKNILHTIDPKMLMAWADVLAFGAKKYHQRNFMVAPGMAWSRVYDSMLRHLMAFWAGEWNDPETGLPHLAHALCNIQFLWTYHQHEQYAASDDRPSSVEYQGRRYADWEEDFKAASKPPEPKMPPAPNFHEGLARSSGNARGPREGRHTGDFSEAHSLTRTESLLAWCKQNGKDSCGIDLRDFENLINMAKGG